MGTVVVARGRGRGWGRRGRRRTGGGGEEGEEKGEEGGRGSRSVSGDQTLCLVPAANLLLTPLRHLVVPPPMAAHTLPLPGPALQVTFAPSPNCNDFLVLLASGEVAVYCYREGGGPSTAHRAPELVGATK